MPGPDAGHPRQKTRRYRVLAALLLAMPCWHLPAIEFACERGSAIEASLGEGVIMRTCSWEKSSGNFIRVGPLQLVKNGVLILQLQTDENGQLHGPYNAWDDNGLLIESGSYEDGRKEGKWLVADGDGRLGTLYFRAGKPLGL